MLIRTIVASTIIVFAAAMPAQAEQALPATKPIPATFDWGTCKAEMAKWCKAAQGSEDIYLCLLKHDEDLSKSCDASHSAYEVATGRKK